MYNQYMPIVHKLATAWIEYECHRTRTIKHQSSL